MKSLRLAGLTLKSMLTDTPILRIAVIAIILVPLLYGALYLWAFWDPYSRLDKMPVALVNLDRPVTLDGEVTAAGNDLVTKLVDGNDVGWTVVSAEEAAAGLKARRYYLSLTIPEDFSANLTTAKSDNPKRAELKVVAQESSNMLASQIMSRVFSEVRAGAGESASRTYIDKMFIGFSDAHDGLVEAALGAKDLKTGLKDAEAGAAKLAKGASDADDGAATLADGLGTLADGADTADSGARKIATNMDTLASGLGDASTGAASLADGASQLSSGLASANTGAQTVAGGAASLAAGLKTASVGATQVAGGLAQLSAGSAKLTDSLGQLATGSGTVATSAVALSTGADQLKTGVHSALSQMGTAVTGAEQVEAGTAGVATALQAYADAHPETAADPTFAEALGTASAVASGSAQLCTGLESAAASGPALAAGADRVAAGASQLAAGTQQIATGITQARDGSEQLSTAAAKLSTGAAQLSAGVASAEIGATALAAGSQQVADGTVTLAGGATKLASGTAALSDGTVTAASGAAKLAVGSATLADGTSQLASGALAAAAGAGTLSHGIVQLDDGANALASGLKPAVTGAGDLRSGLTSGAQALPDYGTALRSKNATMMSNPVELTTQRDGEVPTYGTGFMPYFIPLALWVGALLTYFIIKPLPDRALASGANPLVSAFASYLPGAVFGTLQAFILMAVVQFGLGLKPVNTLATYAFAILTGLVFTAILQMLNGAFGAPGKLISIILLMLQLTSAGGTFPTQMIPGFFQALNPYLPMSYVVTAFRQTVSGGDMATVAQCALVLAGFGVASLAITTIAAWRKQMYTIERLHPSLTL